MPFLRHYAVILPMTVVISFLSVSCGESKVSQCNKIILVANQAVNDAKTITNGGQTSDPNAMLKAADAMDKAAKEMEAVKVADDKIKNYQAEFIKMYQNTSKASREFVTAYREKNRSAAETALKKLQQATRPEKELVSQINAYCAGK